MCLQIHAWRRRRNRTPLYLSEKIVAPKGISIPLRLLFLFTQHFPSHLDIIDKRCNEYNALHFKKNFAESKQIYRKENQCSKPLFLIVSKFLFHNLYIKYK